MRFQVTLLGLIAVLLTAPAFSHAGKKAEKRATVADLRTRYDGRELYALRYAIAATSPGRTGKALGYSLFTLNTSLHDTGEAIKVTAVRRQEGSNGEATAENPCVIHDVSPSPRLEISKGRDLVVYEAGAVTNSQGRSELWIYLQDLGVTEDNTTTLLVVCPGTMNTSLDELSSSSLKNIFRIQP